MNTREKTIDAAVKLFSKNGYHKTKMDDIAGEAGVAKGTLYYNFSSKSALFAEIIVEGIGMILNKIKKKIKQKNSQGKIKSIDKLEILVRCTLQIYIKYDKLVHILVNEISSSIDKQARILINEAQQKYQIYLTGILKNGIKNNELKEVPASIMAGSIIGTMEGAVTTYLKNREPGLTDEEFICSVIELVTRGLVK